MMPQGEKERKEEEEKEEKRKGMNAKQVEKEAKQVEKEEEAKSNFDLFVLLRLHIIFCYVLYLSKHPTML